MNDHQSSKPLIHVEVITRDGCAFSLKTIESLLLLDHRHPEITLTIIDVAKVETSDRSFAGITPSIWVNKKLWFLGSFDSDRFQTLIGTMLTSDQH